MKRFLSLLPAVLVFLLAGCGQGSSISSMFSSESSTKSSEDDSIKRSKTISTDTAAKSVSTVAAATYIFGAITKEYKAPAGFDVELLSAIRQKDPAKGLSALQKRHNLSDDALSAALCSFALRPRMGWPFDPMEKTPARQAFIQVAQASALLANSVGTLVADRLASSVYRNADEATAAALEAFKGIDHQAIREEWISNVKGFELGTVDLASDGSIHFTSHDGLDMTADQNGFRYAKAGHPIFGQDVLSAKKVQLSFESSTGTRMQRERDLTSSESSDQSNSRKSSVEVK